MKQGNLYLVPPFASCTYVFKKHFTHYYIHCTFLLEDNPAPFTKYRLQNEYKISPIDEFLFKRLIDLHPDLDIPHHDPVIYEKKTWMNRRLSYGGLKQFLETLGIIQQLYSRFIIQGEEQRPSFGHTKRFNEVFSYIKDNLDGDLKVIKLAQIANLSIDHFSKIFKSIMGVGPGEFIIRQRLEKAQLLLMFSDRSLRDICSSVGFHSLSHFSNTFKKYYRCTPSYYRKRQ